MAIKHRTHFYESGNLLVEAQNTLFRIHQERLCENSEVFKDMFELPGVGSHKRSSGHIEQIELQDDPLAFALLLDTIYQTTDISFMDVKEQLQIALLAHKYEMEAIQYICQSHLEARLPKDITTRDFHQASVYEDDPSLPPLVVRVGELLHMHSVLPWAMHIFAIQSESSSSQLSEDDNLLRDSRATQLVAVRTINQQAIGYWNRSFKRFIRGYCLAEWWDDEDECWRRSELLDMKKSSFALGKDVPNSLQAISDAVDTWSPELCSLCADGLTMYANDIMARVLGRIGRDVLVLE